jgi:acetyl esterase/lipase
MSFNYVHPELREGVKRFPRLPQLNRFNVRLFRWLTNLQPKPKLPPNIQAEERYIPRAGTQRPLRLCLYKPARQVKDAPALVWMHGGGLVN